MVKKKILHIVESFGSGVFSFLVDLVNKTSDDFDIFIAYGVREETLENFKDFFNNNVNFIKVNNFTRKLCLKDFKAYLEINKIIKDVKPDIIHLHSSKAGFLGRFAYCNSNVKLFYNPHGFSFLMNNVSKIKRNIYWMLEKIASFRKCTIIGCSNGEYLEALKLNKNSVLINNGINFLKLNSQLDKFDDRKVNFDNLKFCTSGRINYQKNPQLFNEIANIYSNNVFTWIGDGDLKDTLDAPNIVITGWMSRNEVIKKENENDIFILTSLWEGLPISLLEAMYFEKLCIVTDCIGNRDVIEDNVNGFIIHNIEDFKNIIEKLKNNKELFYNITQNAKRDVLYKYNIDLMANKYIELYTKN